MDKELDKDTAQSHLFLDQRGRLVELKIMNPSARIQSAAELGGSEQVSVREAKRQGLKAPKKKFMLLRAFKKKYPHKSVKPEAIVTRVVDGEKFEGVDVIDSEDRDEGVFEYVDENYTEVTRSNILTSDTILSNDQNDRVHAAALKTMNKFGDDTNAITVSNPFRRSSVTIEEVPDDAEAVETAGGEPAAPEDEEDDSHLLDPSPFARIFGRIKAANTNAPSVPKRAAPKSAPEPSSKRAKPPAGSGGRNRKRTAADGGEEGEELFGARAPVPSSADDSAVIAGYQRQLDELQKLNCEDSADPAFGPWCKARLSKLGELKEGIRNKKKSGGRRKTMDRESLEDGLAHLKSQIELTQDFLKKASSGTAATEGRYVYEKLLEFSAAGTEDLKLAQWNVFFDDTYTRCKSHLGNAGHAFFGLLASQLAQRLVTNIQGGNKPGPEHVKFLLGFVQHMYDKIECISPDGSGNEAADAPDTVVVSGVKTLLDWKSPPAAVLSAHGIFDKASPFFSHWLIQALRLERGRKVIDAAVANAKSREVQAGVLGSIADASSTLDNFGLLNEEVFQKEGVQASFTMEYAQEVDKAAKVLQDPGQVFFRALELSTGAKGLKGADKEVFNDLASRVAAASSVVVKACLAFEITPFFREFLTSIEKRQKPQTDLLHSSSCILHIKTAGDTKVKSEIEKLGKFLHDFNPKLEEAFGGGLEAAKSQAALQEWEQTMDRFLKSVKAACWKYEELAELVKKVSGAISPLLTTQVNKELGVHLDSCVKIFEQVCEHTVRDNSPPLDSEVAIKFENSLREARSLSTASGEVGNTVRGGLMVIEASVCFYLSFQKANCEAESESPLLLGKPEMQALSFWIALEKEGTDPACHLKKVRLLLEVMYSNMGETFTDDEWAKRGTNMRATLLELFKTSKHVVDLVKSNLHNELQEHKKMMGELTLPPELMQVSELTELVNLQGVVTETFSLEITEKISNAAIALEKWQGQVTTVSKKLKVTPKEIADEGAGQAAWRSCLLWMTPGLK
eukprot:Skav211748  [mRNA]  locus=scaffold1548:487216:491398:- [translate_table: standard]